MEEFAIIVAGGTGSRMKSDIPKQFIAVNGYPVLMHTINAFRRYSTKISIILVLPKEQVLFWNDLCQKHGFAENHDIILGGMTRFDSVKNGLDSIKLPEALIAVHDGVRPVIDPAIIAASFKTATEYGTAVTSVPLKDSIRTIDKNGKTEAQDRNHFRLIQTPQTFRLEWMRSAFAHPYKPGFTDCASVLEAAGYPITLIEGAYENIKITTPEDLKWAEIYLPT
jgi:2-C-methyl-D-erythritol 4-phosphate cytidylyltransferase